MMRKTRIEYYWKRPPDPRRHRTAISLHSHTLHSREYLHYVPRICGDLAWNRAWWTPPLTPRQAWDVEAGQIRDRLRLQPLVSLTDHDNIDGPVQLRVLPHYRHTPISFEWTIRWGPAVFHIGVHQMPPGEASSLFAQMNGCPQAAVPELLARLHRIPGVLIVFNHPLWDEFSVGQRTQDDQVIDLLQRHGAHIHALELNGLRSWSENQRVFELAGRVALPLISGGDRHGCEPNANLNLTNAATFSEFVAEVRDGQSEVLFMPHYRENRTARIIHQVWEVLRDDDAHGLGWKRWNDRIFYETEDGAVKSLAKLWGADVPYATRAFVGLINLMAHEPVRKAVRGLSTLRSNTSAAAAPQTSRS
jgi:hypothetical protein